MEEAKEVHTSLRKAAGLIKFVQDTLVAQLSEKSVDGGDLDGRVCTAYINQCTAEAQEVTIARAIELKHNPSLISALAHETSKMFTTAADNLHTLDQAKFGHWRAYFELKSQFYLAYAYNYLGESLLAEDKCGEAIRCLQESKTCYSKAGQMASEYAKIKGAGTNAKPEKHLFFRRLAPMLTRTLEKCERENGFIYHQKVKHHILIDRLLFMLVRYRTTRWSCPSMPRPTGWLPRSPTRSRPSRLSGPRWRTLHLITPSWTRR